MPSKTCPRCEADISDTYEGADPDVGINSSGWTCETCNLFVEQDDQDNDDYERWPRGPHD